MGTSLTGLTPATTYDALIKVGDNGPLSATAKYLSDGLGNDAPMSMSTTKVGINTSTPDANLHISGDSSNRAILRLASTAANRLAAVTFYGNNVESATIGYEGGSEILSGGVQGDLIIRNVLAGKDIILDTNAGNVGIGTTTPQFKLEVSGVVGGYEAGGIALKTYSKIAGFELSSYQSVNGAPYTKTTDLVANADSGVASELRVLVASSGSNPAEIARFTPNGLTFNGDTAAANALDDYEEGTFTATMTGSISNPTTAVTTTANYTKIGRQVTVSIMFGNVNTTGASGSVRITGLPFSCAIEGTGAVTCELFTLGLTRTSVNSWVGSSSPTTVNLFVSGNDTSFENLGHNPGSGRYLYTSLTYFV